MRWIPALVAGWVGASSATALADVTLYVHNDYGGGAMTVGEGRYDIDRISIGNDQISSVRVPAGWRVVLYEHAHFQGRTVTLEADARSLPSFNDLTSSIVVTRTGPPTVRDRRGRKCADEGGWCDFRGPATVYYGARDQWVVKQQAGRVRCANDVFGDPLVGVGKACFVDGEQPPGPPTVSDRRGRKCADEGGWCDFRGPATVYYGARDKWVVKQQAGRVRCANDVFGDPLVGVGKACFVDGEQPAGVTFYVDADYRGGSMTLEEGRHDIERLTIGNDKLSSVRVPPGWRVVLFEHARFQGRTMVLEADARFLADFNDITSSIAVSRVTSDGYR